MLKHVCAPVGTETTARESDLLVSSNQKSESEQGVVGGEGGGWGGGEARGGNGSGGGNGELGGVGGLGGGRGEATYRTKDAEKDEGAPF